MQLEGNMTTPSEIVKFWLNVIGREKWYVADDSVDGAIRERYLPAWEEARDGALNGWTSTPEGSFAFVILTDQFPRNMFREQGEAFSTDEMALSASREAICKNWDLNRAEPERQFFYLPFMHSESLADQDECIRLIGARMPETGGENLIHAHAHREVIRLFGRFPYRNEALGRESADGEKAYIADGGYASTLAKIRNGAAPLFS